MYLEYYENLTNLSLKVNYKNKCHIFYACYMKQDIQAAVVLLFMYVTICISFGRHINKTLERKG